MEPQFFQNLHQIEIFYKIVVPLYLKQSKKTERNKCWLPTCANGDDNANEICSGQAVKDQAWSGDECSLVLFLLVCPILEAFVVEYPQDEEEGRHQKVLQSKDFEPRHARWWDPWPLAPKIIISSTFLGQVALTHKVCAVLGTPLIEAHGLSKKTPKK